MDLRPRQRQHFSGFTEAEIQRMDCLLKESKEKVLDQDFCKKLAKVFNRSKGRAGKPIVKWTEVQNWFQNRQQNCLQTDTPADAFKVLPDVTEPNHLDKAKENSPVQNGVYIAEKVPDLTELEFEARSSKDGAWYDIDSFLSHRYLSSGDAVSNYIWMDCLLNLKQFTKCHILQEVLVRFIGFGEEEDEWINIRKSVRERSIALEHSECSKVRVRDRVLCFQEKKDQARYFEAQVTEIQKRLHDIRGCRCLFTIRYVHDSTEETVRLRRLCFRPSILARSEET
ncbi:protein SAWADEE HOMEODOMAIN HOMOLOG 1-like isoform X1 [Ipomoea triloba]|uniref:protein SAWADEE HOMEODOMAIN HOMOLOG 1-like isoform X1 n=1 Tax=Ipomoea triloba TaxID=35885 RepID=UPI00125E5068|nr:protein SAWADEE HOMEODOMAIN HOMOLOG 1-like isoform X1 [Ipomoea triloba]